ncbi:hypothetical protein J7382_15145 [Shimia sp. R11_0]|uniref:hypothetical protein n=1 Tax=Shimia sp. R11_0 TaxID=2821096 RepID=UPI001ADC696E|nr:hypothetical protein [Shimia sp. R11_0]MBO9478882.1 hypothetical protein [Shimia sp. R11_0]
MVTQPYYEARKPYPEILTLLEEAGADPSQETARTLWLKNCSNPSTEHQQAIATSSNLPQTLADIRHDVDRQAKLQEIRESADLLREIFAPRVQSGKMSQQELDAEIAKLYAQSGFEPPTAATGDSQ